jgi:Flp pilus assembly pilin Flp
MVKRLRTLWPEEKGQNLPEYALLLFMVSLATISAVGGLATRVNYICSSASTHMTVARSQALVGGSMGYTGEAPADPESKLREDLK